MKAMSAQLLITTTNLLRVACAALLLVAVAAMTAAFPATTSASPSLAGLQREAHTVRVQMAQITVQMKAIEQQYQLAQQHLYNVNAQLSQTRLDLTRAQSDLARQRGIIDDRVVTMYKSDDYSWFDVLVHSASLTDAQTAVDFLRAIAQQDQQVEELPTSRRTGAGPGEELGGRAAGHRDRAGRDRCPASGHGREARRTQRPSQGPRGAHQEDPERARAAHEGRRQGDTRSPGHRRCSRRSPCP